MLMLMLVLMLMLIFMLLVIAAHLVRHTLSRSPLKVEGGTPRFCTRFWPGSS